MPVQTQVATKVADGSLTSVVQSLSLTGTATKAFIMAHPISLSIIGGTFLGIALCSTYKKYQKKNASSRASHKPKAGTT